MTKLRFSDKGVQNKISPQEIYGFQPQISAIHQLLHERKGVAKNSVGWLNPQKINSKEEIQGIKKAVEKIKKHSDVLIVIGIGGSYLGAQAAIQFLNDSFKETLPNKAEYPQVVFAGNNVNEDYLAELIEFVKDKDFSINMISKSGTTLEPAISFRLLREVLLKKYGNSADERIYITTDADQGILREETEEKGWTSFIIPSDIGGRYSVLSSVGLFPIAVSGGDIELLLAGAQMAYEEYKNPIIETNDAYRYAVIRNNLYQQGYKVEVIVGYEPKMHFFLEWLKQLFGESEGKDGKGLYPSSAEFSTDLHSLGQFIQDGSKILFETMIYVEEPRKKLTVPSSKVKDGLDYIEGLALHEINEKVFLGSMIAHNDGSIPVLTLKIPKINEFILGQLFYFFELACAVSGCLLGIHPFDQPGVEAYKKNMFALLGSQKYKDLTKELEEKIHE